MLKYLNHQTIISVTSPLPALIVWSHGFYKYLWTLRKISQVIFVPFYLILTVDLILYGSSYFYCLLYGVYYIVT